jgi:hypothetical protein
MYFIRKMWTNLKRSLWPGRTAQDDQLHPLLVIAVAVLSAHLPHTTPSYPAHQIQQEDAKLFSDYLFIFNQCWGSGSGSVRIWVSRIRIR